MTNFEIPAEPIKTETGLILANRLHLSVSAWMGCETSEHGLIPVASNIAKRRMNYLYRAVCAPVVRVTATSTDLLKSYDIRRANRWLESITATRANVTPWTVIPQPDGTVVLECFLTKKD